MKTKEKKFEYEVTKHFAWAIKQAAEWEGYYIGTPDKDEYKRKLKEAEECLRWIRSCEKMKRMIMEG